MSCVGKIGRLCSQLNCALVSRQVIRRIEFHQQNQRASLKRRLSETSGMNNSPIVRYKSQDTVVVEAEAGNPSAIKP
jgi:hypothetical protein